MHVVAVAKEEPFGVVSLKKSFYVYLWMGVQEVDITQHYLVSSLSKLLVRFNLTVLLVIMNKGQKGRVCC